jgi:hypothetical protein
LLIRWRARPSTRADLPLKGSHEPTSNTDPGPASGVADGETLVDGMAVAPALLRWRESRRTAPLVSRPPVTNARNSLVSRGERRRKPGPRSGWPA